MGKEEKEYVLDEYGDVVREKKNVPVLACLLCVVNHVPQEKLKFSMLKKALSQTGNVLIDEDLTQAIYSHYITDYVLPKVADEYPELKQVLIPREGMAYSDFDGAYFAGGDLPENFDRALYLAKYIADMTMRNEQVSLKRRREILKKLEEVALSPNTNLK